MALDNYGKKVVWAARLGTTPKRCELQLFFAGFQQAISVGKLSISDAEICSFSMISQKIKNYSFFIFLPENLEKIRSTELYGAPLEGSTIFLYRSSLGRTAMKSCRLAELKYAIISRTGCKTKNLRRSNLFLSTVYKHGLLEGSTI